MKKIVGVILALAALTAPTVAMAQDAGREGYSGVLGEVGTIDSARAPSQARPQAAVPTAVATPAQPVASEGSLPFTGTDAGLVALLGGLLIAGGVGLRRLRAEH